VTSVNYGYTAFTLSINGDGFTSDSRVNLDNNAPIRPLSADRKLLTFTVPAGLQPGTHKITVTTNNNTTLPVQFTVHPFKSQYGSLTTPSVRNGLYRGEWVVSNMDPNARSAKVLLIIRRNGEFVETQESTLAFNGYESKRIKLDFGGVNTPYSTGPTQSLSIQAFVIDANNGTPLAEPAVYTVNLNL
jgi:hypothetical protein